MSINRIVTALVGCIMLILLISGFGVRYKHIDANERGVKVKQSGVDSDPVQPGLRFYCPFLTKMYVANVGQQRFVMNNESSTDDKVAHGRPKDEHVFRSSDNQDMHVTVAVQWHRDPTKVVEQQSLVGDVSNDDYFVEVVLRQPVMFQTKNALTVLKAIDAYSGPAHVKAQNDIFEALKTDSELQRKGCIVDTYLVEIALDDAYTQPIKDRQTAIQQTLAYNEQTIASNAKALKAKADAQADLNTVVVAADRDKQVAILHAEQEKQKTVLEAEASNQQVVLAAEAAKQQVVLAAEGEKLGAQNRADAILAVGQANAAAQKLQYSAYAAPGADVFAKIQIAKSMADAYAGVKGWIPEHMSINTVASDFQKSISLIVDPSHQSQ